MSAKDQANKEASARRFGTFGGVFVPNILTLLGIILFLRVGWVVGNTGLWGAIAIISLAHVVTFTTGLSLSAISTSVEAKTGGAYYLISRSLGLEIGGSIGITLYLSQAISVAFYIIGFSQVVYNLFPVIPPQIISTIDSRKDLIEMAKWFSKGKGIISLFQLIVAKVKDAGGKEGMRALAYKNLKRFIEENDIEAFAQAEIVKE